jgi:hypothetical protein
MSKTLLITRPEHDDTTHFLSKWSSKAIEKASEKGIKVLDLYHTKVTQENVESMLSKQNPRLVLLNGHGNEDTVTGYGDKPIITLTNAKLLKGKIVYALSCCSAKELGKKSVEEGAEAYISYDDDFIFVYEPNNISRPLLDDIAKLFLEPSNELIISLIKGNPVGVACSRSKQAFKDNIQKLLSSETTEEDTNLARYLWWDMQHQIYQGEEKASF